jgi:hypothetical protein
MVDPRLVRAADAPPSTRVSDSRPSLAAPSPQALEREYLACLLAPDGRRARALVEQGLAAGYPPATLYPV